MKVGRYEVFREIARGGMGTVHLGRLTSEFNVGRVVAIKRLHAHIASDPQFVRMFLDEARLCARVRHRNVVSLLDLVAKGDDLCMILEYVEGETLGKLLEISCSKKERAPDGIVAGIIAGALHGLHAAHEAKAEDGSPLGIVHRDFTPQNVLVGVDGAARVADFGVAKAALRLQTTRDGQLKGKIAYMAPEQISGGEVDRRADVFAAGVVLWEALAQRRLFTGDNEGQILMKILRGAVDPVTDRAPGVDPAWDRILERALALSPEARFATAREMAVAIESSFPSAPASQIGEWVAAQAEHALRSRSEWVADVERAPRAPDADDAPQPSSPGSARVAATPVAEPLSEPVAAPAPLETALASPEAITKRKRSRQIREKVALIVVATAAVMALALWRGSATSSEVSSLAAPERSDREHGLAVGHSPLPALEPTPSSPPSPVASAEPALAPVVEPAPSLTAASPQATSSAGSVAAATHRVAPRRPPAPASSAGCRYFDAKENIWKFRRGCYK